MFPRRPTTPSHAAWPYAHAAFYNDVSLLVLPLPSDVGMLDDSDLLCGYSSKKCFHQRTTKKGGGLHRFCEFHRQRANTNQWRVDNKRRAVRAQRRQLLNKHRAMTLTSTPTTAVAVGRRVELPLPEPLHEPEQTLTHEDVELLQAMLFDDDASPPGTNKSLSSGGSAAIEFLF